MHRLTREVRFAINDRPDDQLGGRPSNSYGGFPSLNGIGRYLTLRLTLAGPLEEQSQYVLNIRDIDASVRKIAIPVVERQVRADVSGRLAVPLLLKEIFTEMADQFSARTLDRVELALSPFLSYTLIAKEQPMVRLSQKFEFSATHRLHNPTLTDEENCRTFGKCNNPYGHGHNYEVQVTLAGDPNTNGLLVDVPAFERIVADTVIERFDHKNLNLELAEFKDVIPSVENIARTIYGLLKPRFVDAGAKLAAVTVWETPKTWCEYTE